ncbi:31886_t:CDS:2, partial [Gigaspora margarita]
MGNCLASPNQRPRNIGISSQSLNSIPKRNFFHDNEHNNTKKSKTFKRKKIHKNLIGLPSNFQHTGHIGISELRSGKPEKVKTQMAEVAAALRLEINPQINQIPISNQVQDSSSFTSNSPSQFNVKRKQTLPSIPMSQEQVTITPYTISSQNQAVVDPMAEVVAALKMPADGNLNDFVI